MICDRPWTAPPCRAGVRDRTERIEGLVEIGHLGLPTSLWAAPGAWRLRAFRSRIRVVVVDVLQAGLSRILGIVSDPQLGPAGPGHVHVRGHDHVSKPGVIDRLRHVLRPHSHDAADKVDAAMEASAVGIRALWISLAILGGTAVLQAAVVAGSVALLGDTLHNAADALTAVPLGIAFVVGRRPPTRRYTYGYGRAEDLAGVMIVVVIAVSSVLAAYAAVTRLADPHPVSHLVAVAVAAAIGFTGN